MKTSILATGLSCIALAAHAETPVLTVYAGEYFTSEWGPGPAIETGFEAICGCDLQFSTGDLLPRLLLEGARTQADVVIGLSTDVLARARAAGLFAPHGQDLAALTVPVEWPDDTFLPFNWGHTAFVYDTTRMAEPPASLEAMRRLPDGVTVVIQDPRTSISGLALVLWVKAVYGDQAGAFWADLAPHILTVTKGWSESYGLFTSGEADMVLSYTTSPAYHRHVDKTERYRAAAFSEGHYAQIEVAAKVAHSPNQALADQFLAFMLSPEFQNIIPTTNWMYPATRSHTALPAAFNGLVSPKTTLLFDASVVARQRKIWIREWLDALTD